MTTDTTPATVNPDEYNGWTNRETWAAHLWLSNDEATAAEARRIAKLADTQCRLDCIAYELIWKPAASTSRAGERLITYLSDLIADDGPHALNMASDIGSFWRIDALELGAAFLDEDQSPNND